MLTGAVHRSLSTECEYDYKGGPCIIGIQRMGTQYVIVGGSHKQHHTYPTGNPSTAQVQESDYTMSLVYCELWSTHSIDHLFMCMWCRILVVWSVAIRSWIIPILVQSSKLFNQTVLLIHTLILSVYPGCSLNLYLVYCG